MKCRITAAGKPHDIDDEVDAGDEVEVDVDPGDEEKQMANEDKEDAVNEDEKDEEDGQGE